MKKLIKLVTTLVLVTLGAAFLLSGCKKSELDNPGKLLPHRLDSRVELRSGERVRTIVYDGPDSDLKLSATLEYQDGDQTKSDAVFKKEITYRKDDPGKGTISHGRVFYPLVEGEKTQRLAREVEVAVDGTTHVKDRKYWLDGTPKYEGDLVGTDVFQAREFARDGITPVVVQRFIKLSDKWKLAREEDFREQDHSLTKLIVRLDDGSTVTEEYSPEHVVISRGVLNGSESSFVSEHFENDGKTPVKKITQNSYEAEIILYVEGRPARKLKFSSNNTALQETTFDGTGTMVLRRNWVLIEETKATKAGKVQMSDYRLGQIERFDAKGQPTVDYTISKEGVVTGTTDYVTGTKDGTPFLKVLHAYSADGTLEKVTYVTPGSLPNIYEEHSPQEQVRAPVIDPSLTTSTPFDPPPQPIASAPPAANYYDYY